MRCPCLSLPLLKAVYNFYFKPYLFSSNKITQTQFLKDNEERVNKEHHLGQGRNVNACNAFCQLYGHVCANSTVRKNSLVKCAVMKRTK